MEDNNKKTFSFRFKHEEMLKLREIAKERGVNTSVLIEDILTDWLAGKSEAVHTEKVRKTPCNCSEPNTNFRHGLSYCTNCGKIAK